MLVRQQSGTEVGVAASSRSRRRRPPERRVGDPAPCRPASTRAGGPSAPPWRRLVATAADQHDTAALTRPHRSAHLDNRRVVQRLRAARPPSRAAPAPSHTARCAAAGRRPTHDALHDGRVAGGCLSAGLDRSTRSTGPLEALACFATGWSRIDAPTVLAVGASASSTEDGEGFTVGRGVLTPPRARDNRIPARPGRSGTTSGASRMAARRACPCSTRSSGPRPPGAGPTDEGYLPDAEVRVRIPAPPPSAGRVRAARPAERRPRRQRRGRSCTARSSTTSRTTFSTTSAIPTHRRSGT